MYNGNDAVVSSIVERKTRLGLVRDHPDAPGDESLRLYYVLALVFQRNVFLVLLCLYL